jgi:hypothetical protein
MRTIVVLIIAALVLTPTLAHASGSSADGVAFVLAAIVAIPVLLIMLIVHLAKKYPRATEAGEPTALPSETGTAPAVGSDR